MKYICHVMRKINLITPFKKTYFVTVSMNINNTSCQKLNKYEFKIDHLLDCLFIQF